MSVSEKANEVASDPTARGVWLIGAAAVATLVAIAIIFRNQ